MTTNKQSASKLDFGLVLILMLLFISSCVAIYSAQTTGQYNENFLLKQIIWYIAGSGIIAAVIILDSEQWMKITWYVYGIGIALLAFLIVAPESIAPHINGAKSWYKVPGLGSLQPSEFVKVFLILALSRVIVEHHHKTSDQNDSNGSMVINEIGDCHACTSIIRNATARFRNISCAYCDSTWNDFCFRYFLENINGHFWVSAHFYMGRFSTLSYGSQIF